ncbi:hypothetical protein SHELI_v1c05540 [Spiroplasma helicoides]|uniref:Uncharacterized protein n=1 Tax=Spiroplasma helicoides TaxID=216938 RepID=A0A1B3SKR1_9MOLU|nr:hypothetical protein [Spiroplasma helicoides]AOG60505.1 hypothetical protein SHELI_v1c05540 [Spiroplasma helicoides]
MEAKSVYESIIFSLFNLIRNEKLRTKIVLNPEFRNQVITNVNNLLSLEVDYEATYKDKTWSSNFAKAVVNISKEKIKFEKPDNKSVQDSYADYSGLLTVCLNLYSVDRESLTNQLELTEEEIKYSSKVTDEMKIKYADLDQNQVGSDSSNSSKQEVEVVDSKSDKPNNENFNKNMGAGFGGAAQNGWGGFNGFGNIQDIPPKPMLDQRFYPYLTKLKGVRWYKMCLTAAMITCGITFLIPILLILVGNPLMTNDELISNSTINTIFNKKDYSSIFSKGYLLGMTNGGTYSYFYVIVTVAIMSYIIFMLVKPIRNYREKFFIPYTILIACFILLISNGLIYLGNLVPTMTGSRSIQDNIKYLLDLIAKNENIQEPSLDGADGIIQELVERFSQAQTIKMFLWINLSSLILSLLFIVVIIIINPKYDRPKIIAANQNYDYMISELMQGRKATMDESFYEPESEVRQFYEDLREKDSKNKNKDD